MNANPLHGYRRVFDQHFGDCAAQSPVDVVLLDGHHSPCLAGGLDDEVNVNGFKARHSNYLTFDALLRQFLGGVQSAGNHNAHSDDRQVVPISQTVAFAYLNGAGFAFDAGYRVTAHPEIDCPRCVYCSA